MSKRKILAVILLSMSFVVNGPSVSAASNKKAVVDKYFHKRRLIHKKAPIPKDPKVTKSDIKKAKQQAIAGKQYVKKLKGWLKK